MEPELCPCCRARPVSWVWVYTVVDDEPMAYWRQGLDLSEGEERVERGPGEIAASCDICMAVSMLAALAPEDRA